MELNSSEIAVKLLNDNWSWGVFYKFNETYGMNLTESDIRSELGYITSKILYRIRNNKTKFKLVEKDWEQLHKYYHTSVKNHCIGLMHRHKRNKGLFTSSGLSEYTLYVSNKEKKQERRFFIDSDDNFYRYCLNNPDLRKIYKRRGLKALKMILKLRLCYREKIRKRGYYELIYLKGGIEGLKEVLKKELCNRKKRMEEKMKIGLNEKIYVENLAGVKVTDPLFKKLLLERPSDEFVKRIKLWVASEDFPEVDDNDEENCFFSYTKGDSICEDCSIKVQCQEAMQWKVDQQADEKREEFEKKEPVKEEVEEPVKEKEIPKQKIPKIEAGEIIEKNGIKFLKKKYGYSIVDADYNIWATGIDHDVIRIYASKKYKEKIEKSGVDIEVKEEKSRLTFKCNFEQLKKVIG